MNKKAQSLGLTNSNFVTPHGLDNENHYTTAYELALITNYALKNKTFLEIVGTKSTTVTCGSVVKTISNTNELLGNYDGVYGVKTGFTFGAGRCLVTACRRNNLDVISVVLGADTKKIRTSDSIKVLNYTFANYENYDIKNIINSNFEKFKEYFSQNVELEKTTDIADLEISSPDNTIFPLQKDEISNLDVQTFSLSKITAPLPSNTKLGIMSIKTSNEILLNLDIKLKNAISKKTWQTYYIETLQNFFKI